MTTSSSTAPGSSDGAQSSDSNGPLSLDALFSAELSGGQVQRVACARALVGEPAVVFADEPTGNLDSHSTDQVLEILRRSVDDLRQSVVMVTHEPEAAAWADTVIFLRDGHVVAELADPNRDRVLDALRELSETEPSPAAAPLTGSAVKGA